MHVDISETKQESGRRAAALGARLLRETIAERGEANMIVATGASQFEVLEELSKFRDIAWNKVTGFHLDEYVGLGIEHPASFRLYLWDRFISKLTLPLKAFHYLDGKENPEKVCQEAGDILKRHPIDVAFVGIGENAHLAFNDPPADFDIEEPYLVVDLDEDCRRQQQGEGWFDKLESVPTHAISMSVRQILKSRTLICSAPDERKAAAVQKVLECPVSVDVPSSILQLHARCHLFLDSGSASKLTRDLANEKTC